MVSAWDRQSPDRHDPRGPGAPVDPDPVVVMRYQLAARAAVRALWGLYAANPTDYYLHRFWCARSILEEWT